MAKGEYHVGPNGPGPCYVDISNPKSRGCPYGGKSGVENHFKTMEEAEKAYESKMEQSHGLFATVSTVGAPRQLSGSQREELQSCFDNVIADRSLGISVHPVHGYVADSSQALERFYDRFLDSTDHDYEAQPDYMPDSEREVIRSMRVEELGIEIENQNAEEDMDEIRDYQTNERYQNAAYWRSTG